MKKTEATARFGKKIVERVKYRKYGGDDCYSWAIFIDRRLYKGGYSRSEVMYEVGLIYKHLSDESRGE